MKEYKQHDYRVTIDGRHRESDRYGDPDQWVYEVTAPDKDHAKELALDMAGEQGLDRAARHWAKTERLD